MEDPQRCCYSAVTAEAFPRLTRRAEPLPPMKCPAKFEAAPPPDVLPPPPVPVPSKEHPGCDSPTKTLKAFCSALLTSWRFTGADACVFYPILYCIVKLSVTWDGLVAIDSIPWCRATTHILMPPAGIHCKASHSLLSAQLAVQNRTGQSD